VIAQPDDIADGILLPQHLNEARFSKYTFEPFNEPPRFSDSLGNGAASGSTGAINLIHTPYGCYEWRVLGGGQTIIVPIFDRANGLGLDFAQDLANGDGHEIRFSTNITTGGFTRGKHSFVVGGPAFFCRVKMRGNRVDRLNGTDGWSFGFVRHQAYNNTFANYTDSATFFCTGNGTGGVADVLLRTKLNGGSFDTVFLATASTAIPRWANDTSRTFEMRVSVPGRVSVLVDDRVPASGATGLTAVSSFVFDFGDVVMPVARFSNGNLQIDNLFYQEFECGFMAERGGR